MLRGLVLITTWTLLAVDSSHSLRFALSFSLLSLRVSCTSFPWDFGWGSSRESWDSCLWAGLLNIKIYSWVIASKTDLNYLWMISLCLGGGEGVQGLLWAGYWWWYSLLWLIGLLVVIGELDRLSLLGASGLDEPVPMFPFLVWIFKSLKGLKCSLNCSGLISQWSTFNAA